MPMMDSAVTHKCIAACFYVAICHQNQRELRRESNTISTEKACHCPCDFKKIHFNI